jgi:1-acyl-sn-glycerol-3-phosphate acyltransferase
MRVLRRLVTVPIVVMVELILLAFSPLLLAGAAVASVGTRSSRPLRSTALVLAYAVVELTILGRLFRDADDWDAVLRHILTRIYRVLHAILDVRLILEGGSTTREELAESDGVVVLSRHCGPGDSLFIAWLLEVQYGLRLRVVLKSLLRLEPAVDLAGDRLPLCFVGHGGARSRRRVNRCAASMSAGDALLLFPEGGNFSWLRWRRAVAALAAAGSYRGARRARRHTHTLPPRIGGAMAALTGAPKADVLLLAHSGFAQDGRARPWWRLPIHRDLIVRTSLVPAAEVPRDHNGLSSWLDGVWSQVDVWVARHSTPIE